MPCVLTPFQPDDPTFILLFLRCVSVPSDCSVSTFHHLLNVKLRTALFCGSRSEEQLRCFGRTSNAPDSCVCSLAVGGGGGRWGEFAGCDTALCWWRSPSGDIWTAYVTQFTEYQMLRSPVVVLDRRDASADRGESMICCAGCSRRTSRSLSSVDRIGDN